jgi:hypothetical protein
LLTKSSNTEDIEVFNKLPSSKEEAPRLAAGEIVLGTIISIDALGQPRVDFPQNSANQAISAITTLPLEQTDVSRQVALLFNQGDFTQPIVTGLIHSPLQAMIDNYQQGQDSNSHEDDRQLVLAGNLKGNNVCVDGEIITFSAKDEMVFKCGESSITLTKEGKVLIRGKYLLNRSSGVNRIMGGSVQVN